MSLTEAPRLSDSGGELWSRGRQELLGHRLWTFSPKAIDSEIFQQHQRARRGSQPIECQVLSPVLVRWIEANIYPSGTGLTGYFRDISARKQAEDAALQAVQVRDDVLRAVSHDLRNPLSAIKGQASSSSGVCARSTRRPCE